MWKPKYNMFWCKLNKMPLHSPKAFQQFALWFSGVLLFVRIQSRVFICVLKFLSPEDLSFLGVFFWEISKVNWPWACRSMDNCLSVCRCLSLCVQAMEVLYSGKQNTIICLSKNILGCLFSWCILRNAAVPIYVIVDGKATYFAC